MLTTLPVKEKVDSLGIPDDEMSFIIVMGLYYNDKISLGKASQILNISKDELLNLLEKKGLYLNFTKEDLEHDIKMSRL